MRDWAQFSRLFTPVILVAVAGEARAARSLSAPLHAEITLRDSWILVRT